MTTCHRTGFTLRDLQALIGTVAVLIAILLPGLQSARENAREDNCANRLRELAFASHVYFMVNERLPADLSAVGAVEASDLFSHNPHPNSVFFNQNTSVLVQLTPYMGLGGLLDGIDPLLLDFDRNLLESEYSGLTEFWFGDTSSASDLNVNVDEFTCPSDSINQVVAHAHAVLHPAYHSDPNTEDLQGNLLWVSGEGDGRFPGSRTNYVGCYGASTGGFNRGGDLGSYRGAIAHREVQGLFSFPDGISNTVLFGESLGTIQINVQGEYLRNFTPFWFMGGSVSVRGGIGWRQDAPRPAWDHLPVTEKL